ncbi:MAG TPA: HAD family hydrolase, partial [Crenotrichaceae bacterium]|nr:HAD family hydrolase [Crenotrichaceae bacterium]
MKFSADHIYALDFDGVICDSAVETGITGWKAATHVWNEMTGVLPDQVLLDAFRRVRPA